MIPYGYTLGSARNGSTLMVRMLFAHPQIATISHQNGLARRQDRESYLCSCGKPVGECEFYTELFRRMKQRGVRFDLHHWTCVYWMEEDWYNRRHERLNRFALLSLRSNLLEGIRDVLLSPWPARRRAIRRAHRANVALVQSALEIYGRKVWVDGTNWPIRLRYLLKNPELDLRVIHLVRDPRGICASHHRTEGQPWDAAAREWVQANKNCLRMLRLVPKDRQMMIRHETLCDQPVETVDRLVVFLGLEPRGAYDFAAGGHHLLGNAMRMRSLRPEDIRKDERWKQEIPPEHLPTIAQIAGPLARQLGYDI